MSRYLPIFLNTDRQACLVVGGGVVAARKVNQLLEASAEVHVIAQELCTGLQLLARDGRILYQEKNFSEDALTDYILVIAATDDQQVNETISRSARQLNIPVNVVDNPELCSFIMPSVVNRDPIQVAISTGGASPVLARLLKARLETLISPSYGQLALLLKEFRSKARAKFPLMQSRRRFWENILQGPVAEMMFSGQENAARTLLEKHFTDDIPDVEVGGEVYLVGGGPGAPDLLTLRALRLMQQAEVVLYDRLVSPVIIDMVRRDAERIYVGKERDRHALPQDEINELLINLAREGKRVLRLKGGDPFIFGRGGEEIEKLAAAGIPFQVVPGITAASGCATYAGIPLTHRDYAQTCIFVTGHMQDGRLNLNWKYLTQPRQTIAVYMGIKGMTQLSDKLVENGLPGDTPAALIQQGTTTNQKIYIGTLASLPAIIENNAIKPPSIVIIGEVVKLHKQLSWYESSDQLM